MCAYVYIDWRVFEIVREHENTVWRTRESKVKEEKKRETVCVYLKKEGSIESLISYRYI